jgi:lipopolysaccharide/colanic/teichoic acid biosynthesis glycosyltransferase
MSLVGPRPERPYFVDMLSARIRYYGLRHLVKPGITGWAQVLYPYGASVEDAYEKLQYDLYYAKRMSPSFDVRILLSTVEVILFGRGQ